MIHKGTKLACCETIHSVLASRVDIEKVMLTGSTQNAKILMQLPPHLKELYECSVTALEETECREVYKLLNKFSDIFSAASYDLDLIKHQIHTGEAPPIRQPVRRLALAK